MYYSRLVKPKSKEDTIPEDLILDPQFHEVNRSNDDDWDNHLFDQISENENFRGKGVLSAI